MASMNKECQNCKRDFTIEPDDFAFYQKIDVPAPTLCPKCRLQRRLIWRNERNFYHRKCDLCSRSIISVYPADSVFPVHCQKCWWSDKWDPYSYEREYDFSRPFFEQFNDLSRLVPALSIMNDDGIASVNCEYSYDFSFSKNCYLAVCGWYNENCAYSYFINYCKDAFDSLGVNKSELIYEVLYSDNCYKCIYCTLCFDCTDCFLGYDLKGCSNCTCCIGLRNKRYCIFNIQYSKAEYFKKVKSMQLDQRAGLEKIRHEFIEFSQKFPRKYAQILKSVNCSGDFLLNCKSSYQCFYGVNAENCKFLLNFDTRARDSYDCSHTGNPSRCYESVTPDNSEGNKFSIFCWKCTEAEYSNNCHSCQNIFGCVGLKHATYTILNRQYSKTDYLSLRSKIIEHMEKTGEWGEFFPPFASPLAYNETAAHEWFPLTKEESEARGYRWRDLEKRHYEITKRPHDLPDHIKDVPTSITQEVIGCIHSQACSEQCTTAFKITPQELQFYRKMNLPLPRLCPNCRHYQRLKQRNPLRLWHRKCMCSGKTSTSNLLTSDVNRLVYTNSTTHFHGEKPCPNEFETSYAPDRPEIVYCEQCYNAEVV